MVTWYWQDENFVFLSVWVVSIWLHKWVAQSANVAEQNLLSSLQLFAPQYNRQGSLALHKAAPHANSKVSSVFWLMLADIGAVSRGRWPRSSSSWLKESQLLPGWTWRCCMLQHVAFAAWWIVLDEWRKSLLQIWCAMKYCLLSLLQQRQRKWGESGIGWRDVE